MRAVPRIPTRTRLISRLADSKVAIVAAYVALVIVVVLANLEKFA